MIAAAGMTLMQKYYGINAGLNAFLALKNIACPVIKYGIDPGAIKTRSKDQRESVFPYLQTYISNVRQVAWTTKQSGVLTDFDFQMSFFTAPSVETVNDERLFIPFELARIAFTDITAGALVMTDPATGEQVPYASILSAQFHYEFEMKSGSPVPSAFMLAKMRSVCAYPSEAAIADPGVSTDIESGIQINGVNL